MRAAYIRSSMIGATLALLAFAMPAAMAQSATALTGIVSSAEEGPMEGVLVSAKREGSTVTITVVSDRDGRFSFPAGKLAPGNYVVRIRAVGYDLDGAISGTVAAGKTAAIDLKLPKTEDLASQLTNAEWLASMPGTDQQ